jgi:O-antigen ligase
VPFIYIPEVSRYFLFQGNRFEGLFNDPNYFVTFQVIPTLLVFYFILRENKNIKSRVFLFIILCFSVGLIIWSGSRSGLLGLIASFVTLIFLIAPKMTSRKLIGIVFLIIISFPIGFYLIPQESKNDVAFRIHKIQASPTTTTTTLSTPVELIPNIAANQDRLNIWKDSLYFIARDPFGYGADYNEIIDIKGDNESHRVSHNFELELLLTGGIGLFILINFGLLRLLTKAIRISRVQEFNERDILISILIGILISSMFLDSLASRWIWIIVALIIVYNEQKSLLIK